MVQIVKDGIYGLPVNRPFEEPGEFPNIEGYLSMSSSELQRRWNEILREDSNVINVDRNVTLWTGPGSARRFEEALREEVNQRPLTPEESFPTSYIPTHGPNITTIVGDVQREDAETLQTMLDNGQINEVEFLDRLSNLVESGAD